MLENLLPLIVQAEDIVAVMQDLANTFLKLARQIALPIGMIGIIICAIKIMIASDPQSVASTKRWLMFIVGGIIILSFAPAILEQLFMFVKDTGNFNWVGIG